MDIQSSKKTHLNRQLSKEDFALYGEMQDLTTVEKRIVLGFVKLVKSVHKSDGE